jgi:hypothetical protein
LALAGEEAKNNLSIYVSVYVWMHECVYLKFIYKCIYVCFSLNLCCIVTVAENQRKAQLLKVSSRVGLQIVSVCYWTGRKRHSLDLSGCFGPLNVSWSEIAKGIADLLSLTQLATSLRIGLISRKMYNTANAHSQPDSE